MGVERDVWAKEEYRSVFSLEIVLVDNFKWTISSLRFEVGHRRYVSLRVLLTPRVTFSTAHPLPSVGFFQGYPSFSGWDCVSLPQDFCPPIFYTSPCRLCGEPTLTLLDITPELSTRVIDRTGNVEFEILRNEGSVSMSSGVRGWWESN